jgi:hypothetical protein
MARELDELRRANRQYDELRNALADAVGGDAQDTDGELLDAVRQFVSESDYQRPDPLRTAIEAVVRTVDQLAWTPSDNDDSARRECRGELAEALNALVEAIRDGV